MFKFEKLAVWQKSIEYADQVYLETKSFPREEQFGLTSQNRRAAVSISSNIAEGSSRNSDIEFSRFIEIAYGSLMETVSPAQIAQRQDFIREGSCVQLYKSAEEIARMLSGLRNSLRRQSREKETLNTEH